MAILKFEDEWHVEPYQWTYQTNIWDNDFYWDMVDSLPDLKDYRRYSGKYKNRYLYPARDGIWKIVEDSFKDLFGDNIRVQLCRDLPGYSIGPHTDDKKEIMTLLFYLPRNDNHPEAGTSVYEPLDPDFRCDGTKHHVFGLFRKLWTAEYMPNSVFGFIRSDNSFHGVEPSVIVRDLIQVSVWR